MTAHRRAGKLLRPDGDGSRLLIRSRTALPSGPGGLVARLLSPMVDTVAWLMERGMLQGLKAWAEAMPAAALLRS